MLIRIVKMTFKEEHLPEFRQLFDERKDRIKSFEGCLHVELWQDRLHPNIFFTYSHWQHAEALEQYRSSPFFNETWQMTKKLFAAKPLAWSVNQVTVAR